MKKITIATGVALCTLVLSTSGALAKQGRFGQEITFEKLDVDGDGQITKEELAGLREDQLTKADTNGDGMISQEELEAHVMARSKEQAERMMTRLDQNGDQMLSPDELQMGKRANRRFDHLDTDGDGMINETEFAAARERMSKRKRAHD